MVINDMKFSIGIPAYKLTFLGQCIVSILAQTYENFELIIVNDASPENIDDLVSKFDDPRIRYYKNIKNSGPENVVDNWNRCLSYAIGDFFVLMGDDDTMAPNYLEEFHHLITKFPGLDIYHCRAIIIDKDSKPISITASCPEFENLYDNVWHRIKGYRNHFITDFIFRTDVLKKNNGFYKTELAWAADDISSYIAIGNKGIAHTNKELLNYRYNDLSITYSSSVDLKVKAILKTKDWLNVFLSQSKTTSAVDQLLKGEILRELNKYSKRNIISILAYNNIEKNKMAYYYSVWKKRKSYKLNIKEIIFVYILSVKKNLARDI